MGINFTMYEQTRTQQWVQQYKNNSLKKFIENYFSRVQNQYIAPLNNSCDKELIYLYRKLSVLSSTYTSKKDEIENILIRIYKIPEVSLLKVISIYTITASPALLDFYRYLFDSLASGMSWNRTKAFIVQLAINCLTIRLIKFCSYNLGDMQLNDEDSHLTHLYKEVVNRRKSSKRITSNLTYENIIANFYVRQYLACCFDAVNLNNKLSNDKKSNRELSLSNLLTGSLKNIKSNKQKIVFIKKLLSCLNEEKVGKTITSNLILKLKTISIQEACNINQSFSGNFDDTDIISRIIISKFFESHKRDDAYINVLLMGAYFNLISRFLLEIYYRVTNISYYSEINLLVLSLILVSSVIKLYFIRPSYQDYMSNLPLLERRSIDEKKQLWECIISSKITPKEKKLLTMIQIGEAPVRACYYLFLMEEACNNSCGYFIIKLKNIILYALMQGTLILSTLVYPKPLSNYLSAPFTYHYSCFTIFYLLYQSTIIHFNFINSIKEINFKESIHEVVSPNGKITCEFIQTLKSLLNEKLEIYQSQKNDPHESQQIENNKNSFEEHEDLNVTQDHNVTKNKPLPTDTNFHILFRLIEKLGYHASQDNLEQIQAIKKNLERIFSHAQEKLVKDRRRDLHLVDTTLRDLKKRLKDAQNKGEKITLISHEISEREEKKKALSQRKTDEKIRYERLNSLLATELSNLADHDHIQSVDEMTSENSPILFGLIR